jgi:ATP-dependent Clp protease ATP-binding subunit ClpX
MKAENTHSPFILDKKGNPYAYEMKTNRFYPVEVIADLDERIVGQRSAKEALALGLTNHYVRYLAAEDEVKSNVLIYGAKGCGKSTLVDIISAIPYEGKLPYVSIDMLKYDPGTFEADLTTQLVLQDGSKAYFHPLAEYAIVHIENFDAIADPIKTGYMRDHQHKLISYLEGTELSSRDSNDDTISTKHMLFIASGNFNDLERVVRARLEGKSLKGFAVGTHASSAFAKDEHVLSRATIDDFAEMGFSKRLLGRFHYQGFVNDFTADDATAVLRSPNGYLARQISVLASAWNYHLKLTFPAYHYLADLVVEQGANGWSVISVTDKILEAFLLSRPFDRPVGVTVDKKLARELVTGTSSVLNRRDERGVWEKKALR